MTDFTGTQLATILSALDGRTRNPASKAAALAAIRRHADAIGCSLEKILDTAAGLLDGQISANEFRTQLRDKPAAESVESEAGAGPDRRPHRRRLTSGRENGAGANPDGNEPAVFDRPAAAESPRTSLSSNRAWTVKQQLLAACRAAERWLQAESDRPGETGPDEILRMLREAIARAQGQPLLRASPAGRAGGARTPRSRR